jgi:hypothetical protein
MNDHTFGNILILIAIFSVIGVVIYIDMQDDSKPNETSESIIISKVADKITINNIPIKNLQYKEVSFFGGSNPYYWDLWKPNSIIRYYFIEDLSVEKADNYRDTIIGLSLIYPANNLSLRDYGKRNII